MVGIARRRVRAGVKVIPLDLFDRKLTAARRGRCGEDSSLAIEEGSSGTRTSQVCANGIADPEAVPDYLPEANAEGTASHALHSPHAAGRL